MYKGWDVHAYTSILLEIIQNNPEYMFIETISQELFDQTLNDITQYVRSNKAQSTLNSMKQLYDPILKGYFDPELQNLNIPLLLYHTWNLVKHFNDNSIYNGFDELLTDIGNTCIQGHSHRLLFYYIGLTNQYII